MGYAPLVYKYFYIIAILIFCCLDVLSPALDYVISLLDVFCWFGILGCFWLLSVNRYLIICLPHGHKYAVKAQNMRLIKLSVALLCLILTPLCCFYLYPEPHLVYYPDYYTFGYKLSIPEAYYSQTINIAYNVTTTILIWLLSILVVLKVRKTKNQVNTKRTNQHEIEKAEQLRQQVVLRGCDWSEYT